MRIVRARVVSAVVAVAVLALGGCASATEEAPEPVAAEAAPAETPTSATAEPSPQESPTAEPSPTTPPEPEIATLPITVRGDEITPNAKKLKLGVGEPLLLTFDADRAGELHVHSKPDQYIDFEAGTSEQEITVDVPGVIEIEDHDTLAVIALVEVR